VDTSDPGRQRRAVSRPLIDKRIEFPSIPTWRLFFLGPLAVDVPWLGGRQNRVQGWRVEEKKNTVAHPSFTAPQWRDGQLGLVLEPQQGGCAATSTSTDFAGAPSRYRLGQEIEVTGSRRRQQNGSVVAAMERATDKVQAFRSQAQNNVGRAPSREKEMLLITRPRTRWLGEGPSNGAAYNFPPGRVHWKQACGGGASSEGRPVEKRPASPPPPSAGAAR